jgi:hypothetical protein
MLLLIWTTQFLFTATKARSRHVDQRWLGLDHLAQLVTAILTVRAVELHPIRRRPRRNIDRFNTRPGFRRPSAPTSQIRAILGARLRRQLYTRDPFKRIGLLLNPLRNLDALASRIGARARRGLNRLRALTAIRPPHDVAPARLAYAVAAADSS